jgi:hypothetical protein
MHGQGDIPAAGGILAGRRLPGGCSQAVHLGRRGGGKRDDDRGGSAAKKAEGDGDGASDGGSCGGNDSGEAASVTSPRRQASDHLPGLWPGRRLELRPGLDSGLRLNWGLALGNRVEPGDGLIFGVRSPIGPGSLLGHGNGHCGDGSFFEVGAGLDVRGQVLDDPADLAVLVDDALAVAATGQMAVELGSLGRGQVAKYEVEGLGVSLLDISIRKHRRRHFAGWPARLSWCRRPWPCGI